MTGLALLICAVSVPGGEYAGSVALQQEKNRLVIDAANGFGLDLYGRLASRDRKNLFLSPASIHVALSMTFAGAAGETAAEMGKVLGLKDNSSPGMMAAYGTLLGRLNAPPRLSEYAYEGDRLVEKKVAAYQLHLVNALWAQKSYPFGDAYLSSVRKQFMAELRLMDFATEPEPSRGIINAWVEKQTRNRIKNLLARGLVTGDTRLILTNAVYFKSNWAEKFLKGATEEKAFHLGDGTVANVPQMLQETELHYAETADLQLLALPYKAHQLEMVVLLPRARDGLAALEKRLTPTNLAAWLGSMKHVNVRVTLPKWEFESGFSLRETLQAMGMRRAFRWPGADFTVMSPTGELFISDAVHKAFVAVDEEGTEAAAATAVAVAAGAVPREPEKPRIFTADHPYLFLIRHRETGLILFLGRVEDPR